jgi:hypothetical protein
MSDDWREELTDGHRWKNAKRKNEPHQWEFYLLHLIENLLKHDVKLTHICPVDVDLATLQRFVSGERGLSLNAFAQLMTRLKFGLVQNEHELDLLNVLHRGEDTEIWPSMELSMSWKAQEKTWKEELRERNKRFKRGRPLKGQNSAYS